jgi:hypothetical protein
MARSAADGEFPRGGNSAANFLAQPEEIEAPHGLADFIFIACILALGALALFSCDRASDFLYDDVYYADCARSLLERGFYGISDRPETTQPPGVSAVLAVLCLAGGCTRAVFLSAMAIFETLGFLACYALLGRQIPRVVAGGICLLLMSSSVYFSLATQWVSTCFLFLVATMGVLVVTRKLERAASLASRIACGCLLALLLAASLMFGSTAIALPGSIVVWIGLSALRDRGLGVSRLKMFAAVLLVSIAVEGFWMQRKPPQEWPVPGFPGPYLQQVVLKDGHFPELGRATGRDIPVRMGKKAFQQSMLLANVLFRRWIDDSWASLLIMGPVILIVVGWVYSVWKTGGGLEEWYFAGCEIIFLLWPWRMDTRTFLPVAPLACLYLWRGAPGLWFLATNETRVLGAVWLPVAAGLTYASWEWMRGPGAIGPMRHAGLQGEVSFAVWMLSGIFAGWMVWKGSAWMDSFVPLAKWYSRSIGLLRLTPGGIAKSFGGAVVASLIVMGVTEQVKIRRSNLDATTLRDHLPPDVEAALWVRAHAESDAVVMARQVPTTYHYSGRKEMVWFPPSSNPQILMEGIRKYKVNYVILIRRNQSYFLPPEEDCFAAVLAGNGNAFRLVAGTPAYRIYETEPVPERRIN